MKDWSIVEVLKHSRHDWLNKIQLIKGNLALSKYDRVKEIIDEIVIETQNEARLTNLQLETLAAFLMTYNWETHKFPIEFEVIGDARDLSSYDVSMTAWCEQFFQLIEGCTEVNGENQLLITIELFEEEVRFLFDFSGIINNIEVITDSLEKTKELDQIQLMEYEVHPHELLVTIALI
ncbi:sporulation initiation phosphotransferase B [Bacillus sp. PS06]|uniref:sporulation initiation phosphotransferase B n=1 Tax=Bacillus sp. PS06 TaxID=2764176 RepID=UPI001CD88062|nr:sporulation initiation phosphotransferase B [Bacillus sp. PS06]